MPHLQLKSPRRAMLSRRVMALLSWRLGRFRLPAMFFKKATYFLSYIFSKKSYSNFYSRRHRRPDPRYQSTWVGPRNHFCSKWEAKSNEKRKYKKSSCRIRNHNAAREAPVAAPGGPDPIASVGALTRLLDPSPAAPASDPQRPHKYFCPAPLFASILDRFWSKSSRNLDQNMNRTGATFCPGIVLPRAGVPIHPVPAYQFPPEKSM